MLNMKTHTAPMHMARCLHFCLALSLWVALVPFLVSAQAAPSAQEWMQKKQAHEIENIVGRLEENNTSADYLLYVVVPLVGLIGVLTLLRRLFLN
jgi:C4-dicarboxylate transporter